jgi:hypothetical protein
VIVTSSSAVMYTLSKPRPPVLKTAPLWLVLIV